MTELQIRPGEPYSITISPNYKQGNPYSESPDEMQTNFMLWFAGIFHKYGHSDLYVLLYPDIGQPMNFSGYKNDCPGSKMHLHGFIYFQSWEAIRHWYMKLSKIIAHGPSSLKNKYDLSSAIIDIDTIGDIATWYKYCTKAISTMWIKKQTITNIEPPMFEWLMDWIPRLPAKIM